MYNYKDKYSYYLNIVEEELKNVFNNLKSKDIPQILSDSMEYAVMGGGKRVRPVLCLATSEMLGVKIEDALKFALSIEFIHSYSLVHDDLPAMDNDDFRRGKLSTHKKFGEAYGILAGDALLNFAFENALSKENFNALDGKALKVIADCAGSDGMVKGQVLDLKNEQFDGNEKDMMDIYINKTSKLLSAPLLVASELAGGKYYDNLLEYGTLLGIMFQISDDFMDVEGTVESIGKSPNKDLEEGKLTSIKVYGLDGARNKNTELFNRCMDILKDIPDSEFLQDFTLNMYKRKK